MPRKEIEEKIQARVQEHYDYLAKRIPVERIIGVFAYGSVNYGFYEEGISDVDTKAIVLPSFENLMGGHKLISKEYILENGEHCEVKDIRLYVQQLKKQSINFVETLFTQYYVLTPQWEDLWEQYFVNHSRLIAHYDELQTIHVAGHHLLSIKGRTGKDIYNILRLHGFIKRYYYGYAYPTCIETLQFLNPMQYKKIAYYKSQRDTDFSNHSGVQKMVTDIREDIDAMLKYTTPSNFSSSVNNILEERRQQIDSILIEAVSAMLIPYLNREKGQRYPLKRTKISN